MRITFKVAILLGCLVTASAAQERPSVSDRARRLAGCYSLWLGAWTPPQTDSWTQSLLPLDFKLDTLEFGVPAARNPRTVQMPNYAESRGYKIVSRRVTQDDRYAVWRPGAGGTADSVSIAWSTGFGGLALVVVQRGDSLVGVASQASDYLRPFPTAPAIARRASCR